MPRRLRALAAAHQAQAFSDLQLLARAWWLMLVAGQVLSLEASPATPWWGAPACALAGLGVAPVQGWVFLAWPPGTGAPPARTLLFLRAFGHQARTERLFGRLGARWRAIGSITLIAAPDVVARSMDPADLLVWLQGREARAFVRDAAGLALRLAAIDRARDPDGLHRLNGFCCTASTWQATVVALMAQADAVLMDLRAVPAGSAGGCAWKLAQLAQRLPGWRVAGGAGCGRRHRTGAAAGGAGRGRGPGGVAAHGWRAPGRPCGLVPGPGARCGLIPPAGAGGPTPAAKLP